MSKEAALAFRDKVNESPDLQAKIRRAIEQGKSLDEAVLLGKQNGFEFTVQEAQEALESAGTGELSDFELEVVAGGKSWAPLKPVSKPQPSQVPTIASSCGPRPAVAFTIAVSNSSSC